MSEDISIDHAAPGAERVASGELPWETIATEVVVQLAHAGTGDVAFQTAAATAGAIKSASSMGQPAARASKASTVTIVKTNRLRLLLSATWAARRWSLSSTATRAG